MSVHDLEPVLTKLAGVASQHIAAHLSGASTNVIVFSGCGTRSATNK